MAKRTYELMLFNHLNHLKEVKRREFDADERACHHAMKLFNELSPSKIEVWNGARRICSVDSNGIQLG